MFSGISWLPASPAQHSSAMITSPGRPAVAGTGRTAVRSATVGAEAAGTRVGSTITNDIATMAAPPSTKISSGIGSS